MASSVTCESLLGLSGKRSASSVAGAERCLPSDTQHKGLGPRDGGLAQVLAPVESSPVMEGPHLGSQLPFPFLSLLQKPLSLKPRGSFKPYSNDPPCKCHCHLHFLSCSTLSTRDITITPSHSFLPKSRVPLQGLSGVQPGIKKSMA